MMKYLQKLGKALMLPVAALPVCGILMGIGYAFAPAVMGAEGATSGFAYTLGFLLIKAGGALIDNMAWLFAIGAAVGLSDDHDGTAGLAGLVSFLMMQQLLSPGVVGAVRTLEEGSVDYIAFSKIAGNSFIGILAAIIGAACYNKFKNTQLPDWLAFFSGKRSVAIVTAVVSIVVSVILLFVWPIIFGVLVALGNGIAKMSGIGAGIYAFLNRLLIPTGLHHALNNVFWFDTIGLGDLKHFWAGDVTGQNGVNWDLGMYMSGFFPCMMFGIPGAALAMVQTAKNKKAAIGLVVSAAICAFVCGVTEPFEFGFMFLCFPLYVVYAALYGIFTIITYYTGFRAGFCFSDDDLALIHKARQLRVFRDTGLLTRPRRDRDLAFLQHVLDGERLVRFLTRPAFRSDRRQHFRRVQIQSVQHLQQLHNGHAVLRHQHHAVHRNGSKNCFLRQPCFFQRRFRYSAQSGFLFCFCFQYYSSIHTIF